MRVRRVRCFELITVSVAVLSTTAAAQQSSPSPRRLTLAAAVARADSVATAVQLSRDSLSLSAVAVLESYGHFLPSVAAGAGTAQEQGTTLLSSTALVPADTRFRTAAMAVSTSLNLFNGFRDSRTWRASQALHDAAGFSLTRARQQVAFDVTQAFEQTVLDARLVRVATATLALSRAREAQLTGQVAAGTRAPPDLYRQRALTSSDESVLIEAHARETSDRIALLRRLRIEPRTPIEVVAPDDPDARWLSDTAISVDSLTRVALDARPDLQVAADRQSAAGLGVDIARGGYLPRVSLGVDLFTSARVFDWERLGAVNQLTVPQSGMLDQLGRQRAGLLSLAITWPLFDRYATRFDVQRSQVTLHREQLAAEDLRLRVSGEVQQAGDLYVAAVQQWRSARMGIEAATMAFDAVTARYDSGLATFVDVLSAQAALTRAQALLEQAVANVRLQRAVLGYVTGTSMR